MIVAVNALLRGKSRKILALAIISILLSPSALTLVNACPLFVNENARFLTNISVSPLNLTVDYLQDEVHKNMPVFSVSSNESYVLKLDFYLTDNTTSVFFKVLRCGNQSFPEVARVMVPPNRTAIGWNTIYLNVPSPDDSGMDEAGVYMLKVVGVAGHLNGSWDAPFEDGIFSGRKPEDLSWDDFEVAYQLAVKVGGEHKNPFIRDLSLSPSKVSLSPGEYFYVTARYYRTYYCPSDYFKFFIRDNTGNIAEIGRWAAGYWQMVPYGWQTFTIKLKAPDKPGIYTIKAVGCSGHGTYSYLGVNWNDPRVDGGFRGHKPEELSWDFYEVASELTIFVNITLERLPIYTTYGRPPYSVFTREPVNVITGNYLYQKRDLFIQARGLSISFYRTYNSRDPYSGPLGHGWTHNFNIRLEILNQTVIVFNEDGRGEIYRLGPDGKYIPSPGVFDNLTRNPDGTFTLIRKDSRIKLHFDPSGKLLSIEDRNGNKINLIYEGSKLSKVVDASGREVLKFNYDSQLRIVSIEDVIGRHVYYKYDENGDLVEAVDVRGSSTKYVYQNHKITKIIDPRGKLVLTNYYDDLGRVIKQVDAFGYETSFEYLDGETIMRDPMGNRWTYYYDEAWRITKEVDPLGRSTAYSYDERGNLVKITDRKGNSILLEYNERGDLVKVVDRSGTISHLRYDNASNLVEFIDQAGNRIEMSYDARGNLLSIKNQKGNVMRFSYDEFGQLREIVDAKGGIFTFEYDNHGNVIRMRDPGNSTWSYSYDEIGRLLSATDPLGNSIHLVYDNDWSVVKKIDQVGAVTSFIYDESGNLIEQIDPMGYSMKYVYDNASRLIEVIDPLGRVTRYEYNPLWLLSSVIDSNGRRTSYEYDPNGNLIRISDPMGREISFTYDPNGNVLSQTDRMGRTISYKYDADDRLTEVVYPNGQKISILYDVLGRVVKITNGTRQMTFEYDEVGNLLNYVDWNGRKISYAYDELNRVISITYPDNKTVFYEYNALSRLKSVKDWRGRTTVYEYDSMGYPVKAIYPNGIEVSYEWDPAHRLTKITTQRKAGGASIPIVSYEYSYDLDGRRTSVKKVEFGREKEEIINYRYDPIGQLIEVSSGKWRRSYFYDNVGNLIKMVEEEGEAKKLAKTTNYYYNELNQLVKIEYPDGGVEYLGYDGNGNLINETLVKGGSILEQRIYSYGFENELLKVDIRFSLCMHGKCMGNVHKVVEHGYDPLGNRVERKQLFISPNETLLERHDLYVNDIVGPLTRVLQTYDAVNGTSSSFVYGINRIAGFKEFLPHGEHAERELEYYYVYDGLGSVVGLTNENGALIAKYSYDEFGMPSPATEAQLKLVRAIGLFPTFAFTGEDYDEAVNLIFLRARYYSPSLKRFISEDDFSGIPTIPISLNRYIYCHNSPVSYVDPTGHIVWIPLALLIGGLIGGAANVVTYHFTTPADQRSKWGYLEAFGKGFAAGAVATGVGMAVGWLGLGAIESGLFAGFASGLVSNYLEGRPLWEDLLVSTIIGAVTGGIVPKIPGLRFRGPAPSLQWYKGWPIGGYVGKNTYRYIYRLVVSKILGKAAYAGIYAISSLSRLIEDVFVAPYPPSGTLVVQLNKRW
jgi:RHS repeat-associated protein